MSKSVIFKPAKCYPPMSKSAPLGFDRVRLKAGVNHLNAKDFQILINHPDYQSYADRGAVVAMEPEKVVEDIPLSDTPANLGAYNVGEAEDIVNATEDIDVLKRWLSAETRKTTRDDLIRQIKDLGGSV